MEKLRDSLVSAIFSPFSWAFSSKTRQAIGKRDHWECQDEDCDKAFRNGDMVHASHLNHDKKRPEYDDVSNGLIECVDHHKERHKEAQGHAQDIGLTEAQNDWAILALEHTERHTKQWLKEHQKD